MKRRHLYLSALAAALLFFQSCQKEVTNVEDKPEPNPITKVDPPAGNVNFTVKQKNVAVADAKIRWFYTENGTAKKDSVVTNSSGIASASIPVNTATKLEIISHCGIMLYERGFGPFTQGQTVDTTIAVMANTITCETTPPDQYFIFRVNGVHYRLVTPTDQFSHWWEAEWQMGGYVMTKGDDPSINVRLDETSWGMTVMGIFIGSISFGSYPDEFSYVPTTPGYMEGKLVQQLEHLGPPELDPDTEYKIPCWFKLKIGAKPPPPDPASINNK